MDLPVTPYGLIGSLSPNLLIFFLHRFWFIGMNLSLDLHRIRQPSRRILRLHITSQEPLNLQNIVNRLLSRKMTCTRVAARAVCSCKFCYRCHDCRPLPRSSELEIEERKAPKHLEA